MCQICHVVVGHSTSRKTKTVENFRISIHMEVALKNIMLEKCHKSDVCD